MMLTRSRFRSFVSSAAAGSFLFTLAGPVYAEVTFDWVTAGNPGNAADSSGGTGFGAVGYTYQISKNKVTNAQYTEFLNAKAQSDPFGL